MGVLFKGCKDLYDLVKQHCTIYNKLECYYVECNISQENPEGLFYSIDVNKDLPILFETYNDYKEFETKADIFIESEDNVNFRFYVQKEININSVERIRQFLNVILSNIY